MSKLKRRNRPHYIYGLCDPRDGLLKYVGKSIAPDGRLGGHIAEARDRRLYNPNPQKSAWINELLSAEMEPELFIIEECTDDDWIQTEKFWIEYFRFLGFPLTNSGMTKQPRIYGKEALDAKEERRIADAVWKSGYRTADAFALEEESEEVARQYRRLDYRQRSIIEDLIKEFRRAAKDK